MIATSRLYAVNTLGAALGCYLAGFHILSTLGLVWTNITAAVLNVAVGLLAVCLSQRRYFIYGRSLPEPPMDLHPEAEPATSTPGSCPSPYTQDVLDPRAKPRSAAPQLDRLALASLALTGIGALTLQMVWSRQLALILGSSTYAFTSTLFVILVGIAIGSHLAPSWVLRLNHRDMGIRVALVAIMASLGFQLVLLSPLTLLVGLLKPLRGAQGANALLSASVATTLLLIPSVLMGLLYPLLTDKAKIGPGGTGRVVGNAYLMNSVGTAAGAMLTPLIFIPRLGLEGSIVLVLGVYAAALVLQSWPLNRPHRRLAAVGLTCAVIMSLGAFRLSAPVIHNAGMHLYGYESPASLYQKTMLHYYKAGATCNVMVSSTKDHLSLRVNGKVDASTGSDMTTQIGLALIPTVLRPHSKELLVIGYGSGVTCGTALLFPGVSVTCCEIEPAVFRASRCFSAVNRRPEDSPRFSIVFDDARSFIQGVPSQYDIIISEPSNPWISGVSSLFTVECYEAMAKRLTHGGVLAQWIQTYQLAESDYALIVNTVRSVFPHASIFALSSHDTVLVASRIPLFGESAEWDRSQEIVDSVEHLGEDLRRYFGSKDVRTALLGRLVLEDRGVEKLLKASQGCGENTDYNLRLEFEAPLRLFAGREIQGGPERELAKAFHAEGFAALYEHVGASVKNTDAVVAQVRRLTEAGQLMAASSLYSVGMKCQWDHPSLEADQIILTGVEGRELREKIARIGRVSLPDASRVGVYHWGRKEYEKAIDVFEVLVEMYEHCATNWANLAKNYAALGRSNQAQSAFEKAQLKDPLNKFVKTACDEYKKTLATMGFETVAGDEDSSRND